MLCGDAMFAAGAVDFMCRERRGAAVQCGGKNRDRYLLTWQDFNKGARNVFPFSCCYLLSYVLFHVNILETLLMFQQQQQQQQQGLCEMPSCSVVSSLSPV